MFLHYLSLPFKVIRNIFTIISLPFGRDLPSFINFSELGILGSRSEWFHKFYYYNNEKIINETKAKDVRRSYLQKNYGFSRYPNNSPMVAPTHKDVLYGVLGSLKDRDLGIDTHFYEEACYGIINNNLASIIPEDFEIDIESKQAVFRPRVDLTSSQALTILCLLKLLSRGGDTHATSLYKKLLWNRGYFLFVLFPDLRDLETVLIAFHIIIRYEENRYAKAGMQLLLLLFAIFSVRRHTHFFEYITKRAIAC